jgi:uncharacterized membrane protein
MPWLLLLCYPLCVHMAVITRTPALQVLAICCLAAAIQYSGLRRGNGFSWLVLISVVLVSVWLAAVDMARYVLYVPPIIIPLLIWSGFIRTLLPGQVPLITAIGEQFHGQLPPEITRYTRRVTIFWALTLALLVLWTASLPLWASPLLWSLFSNFINYALVVVLFVLEFIYRRWRFRSFEQPSFREYLHIVFQSGAHRI